MEEACQVLLSMGFPRREYWSGLPFPSPGDLPDPGIKPMSPSFRQILYHPATLEAILFGTLFLKQFIILENADSVSISPLLLPPRARAQPCFSASPLLLSSLQSLTLRSHVNIL